MCGIAGVIDAQGVPLGLLHSLAASLEHRGPDDEGYVTREEDGSFRCWRGDQTVEALAALAHWRDASGATRVGLCHRRLSILDLSPAGHQPMVSSDGNLALVFGGEIYNYLELADELERLGWRLRPCGDTAVLLAAFAEWGPDCVHRLRGMWAFAVYDRRSGKLTLSRDRFGIKPLYHTRQNGLFAFSSEIKGLLPALPRNPYGSTSNVARLLAWGRLDDEEATLFEGVSALPAGCNLHVDANLTCQLERYYDVAAASAGDFDGSLDNAIDEYSRRLDTSVRLHMRSDVEVGSCLSGGLDSNLTAALAVNQLASGRLSTFTAVYEDPRIDERRYVDLHAVRSRGLRTHFTSPTAEGLLAEIDRLAWAQDQPIASSSPFAQWSVMQLAADHNIKVLLDGQGADEAIGGYSYFAGAYLLELLLRGDVVRALRATRVLGDRRGISVWRELGRAAYHQLPAPLQTHTRRATRVGYDLLSSEYQRLAGSPRRTNPRTFRDYSVDAIRHSLPELLRYEDRSSMAFSIESRVPFLDHPLVEFVLALPTRFKFKDGWSKYVQRRAAADVLPAEIVWRRDKLGFATPQREWKRSLASSLAGYVRDFNMPTFLDRAKVERLVGDDRGGGVALSDFWRVLSLLKWMETFNVQFSDS